jgi:peptide deformylase
MTKQCHLIESKDLSAAKDFKSDDLVDLYKIYNKLEFYCLKNNLDSLTAVQLGIDYKVLVLKNLKNSFDCYVNCTYQGLGNLIKSLESCPSLRINQTLQVYEVNRYQNILLSGLHFDHDVIKLSDISLTITGKPAVILQHEIDHFNGQERLLSKIGNPIDLY